MELSAGKRLRIADTVSSLPLPASCISTAVQPAIPMLSVIFITVVFPASFSPIGSATSCSASEKETPAVLLFFPCRIGGVQEYTCQYQIKSHHREVFVFSMYPAAVSIHMLLSAGILCIPACLPYSFFGHLEIVMPVFSYRHRIAWLYQDCNSGNPEN